MWSFDLPMSLRLVGKKATWLNMNWYRNAFYRELNDAKVLFKQRVEKMVIEEGIDTLNQIHLHYDLYLPNKTRRDLRNVTSVVDKFFSDVLTEVGVIPDDNVDFVVSTSDAYRGLDRENPRVTVTIYPVTEPVTITYR